MMGQCRFIFSFLVEDVNNRNSSTIVRSIWEISGPSIQLLLTKTAVNKSISKKNEKDLSLPDG